MKEVIVCECKNWLEAVGKTEMRKIVRKLNRLNGYYLEKEGETNVSLQGFIIASEFHEELETAPRARLTTITPEDFQDCARKAGKERILDGNLCEECMQ